MNRRDVCVQRALRIGIKPTEAELMGLRVVQAQPPPIEVQTDAEIDTLIDRKPRGRFRPNVIRLAVIACLLVCPTLLPAVELPAGQWHEAIVTAYSPHDALDRAYHQTKGADRWRTAYGSDVRAKPYGIAAPPHLRGRRIYLPLASNFLIESHALDRIFTVDDTGALVTSRTETTGILHLDLRYRTEHSALRYGVQRVWVYVVAE